MSNIEPAAIESLDSLIRSVGAWLHEERYIGVFGMDALCRDDEVFFTEVNPRFQGSSALSAEIADELEVPDLFLDHLAASLGLVPDDSGLSVAEWCSRQPALSHIVVHNIAGHPVFRDVTIPTPPLDQSARLAQVLPRGVRANNGATLSRMTLSRSVTKTGFEVDDTSAALVAAVIAGVAGDERSRREAAGG